MSEAQVPRLCSAEFKVACGCMNLLSGWVLLCYSHNLFERKRRDERNEIFFVDGVIARVDKGVKSQWIVV